MSPIEEIIEEARNGRMFILIDDEDRENEGDLVIPAQMATPEAVNFMAKYGRGLICLAMTRERVDQLGLSLMAPRQRIAPPDRLHRQHRGPRRGDHRHFGGGPGAYHCGRHRSRPRAAQDIVSPGHVFPLVAREGGVLVRAGHTEAAVDMRAWPGSIRRA